MAIPWKDCVSEGSELEYSSVIMDFVDGCEQNLPSLNTSRIKELVIDTTLTTLIPYRKGQSPPPSEETEVV